MERLIYIYVFNVFVILSTGLDSFEGGLLCLGAKVNNYEIHENEHLLFITLREISLARLISPNEELMLIFMLLHLFFNSLELENDTFAR